jgi:hypothetical protein
MNLAENIYEHISVTLREKFPSYCTVKKWVAGFRTGHLSSVDEESSGRPTQVTVPDNVNTIHSMILADRVYLLKHSRDPGEMPRKSKLYYSEDFRNSKAIIQMDLLCGLVARVLGYRFVGTGSIPGTTRKKM